MGNRIKDPRLKELWDKGETVYSISRIDTINNCLYEAYKTYILHSNKSPNIYSCLGSRLHETLEGIVNGENSEADLFPAMQEELENMEMLGINFPKDFKGKDSIKTGWIDNITHFCNDYISPRGDNLETEQLFIYKTPKGRYLQGYIDLIQVRKDNHIAIYDYKTSSMYSGAALKEHGRQLVLYALGKEQEGFVVDRVAWIFLKYVDITYKGYKTTKSKNKSEIKKTVERRKIYETLAPVIEEDAKDLGYDNLDIQIMMNKFKEKPYLTSLPENIASKYIIKPCVLYYELTDEVKRECIDYIDNSIDMWESLTEEDYIPRKFTKMTPKGNMVDDVFYCLSLCDHRKTCPYIAEYMNSKTASEEEYDLF